MLRHWHLWWHIAAWPTWGQSGRRQRRTFSRTLPTHRLSCRCPAITHESCRADAGGRVLHGTRARARPQWRRWRWWRRYARGNGGFGQRPTAHLCARAQSGVDVALKLLEDPRQQTQRELQLGLVVLATVLAMAVGLLLLLCLTTEASPR